MTSPKRLGAAFSLSLAILVAACAGGDAPSDADVGSRVAISAAPLDLAGVGYVCYDLAVTTPEGTVWSQGSPTLTQAAGDTGTICSTAYGDGAGGGIAYVGPCDASYAENTVTLWVDGLYAADGTPLGQWQNPCGYSPNGGGGCSRPITCDANADSAADFSLTIARAANQGFFDIAVDFGDIFCSAKLDCTYDEAGEEPITLMKGPDGAPIANAVVGFACTGGAGDTGSTLHMTDVRVSCGEPGEPIDAGIEPFAYTCTPDGSVLASVLVDLSIGSDDLASILGVVWTGAPGEARVASLLPSGVNTSASPMIRRDDTHVVGLTMDFVEQDPVDPHLTTWAFDGTSWAISDALPVPGTTFGGTMTIDDDGALWHDYYDTANDRQLAVFAPTATGYTGPSTFAPSGDLINCQVRSHRANVAAGFCSDSNFSPVYGAWRVAAGGASVSVFEPFPGLPTFDFGNVVALPDGSVLWNRGDQFTAPTTLRFTYGAGGWTASSFDFPGVTGGRYQLAGTTDLTNGVLAMRSADDGALKVLRFGADGSVDFFGPFTLFDQAPTPLAGIPGTDLVHGVAWREDLSAYWPFIAELAGDGSLPAAWLPAPGGAPGVNANGFIAGAGLPLLAGSFQDELGGYHAVVWKVPSAVTDAVEMLLVDPDAGVDATNTSGRGDDDVAHAPNCGQFFGILDNSPAGGSIELEDLVAFDASAAGPTAAGDLLALPPGAVPGLGGAYQMTRLDPTVAGLGYRPNGGDPDPNDIVYDYAVYRGEEQLQCAGASCNKLYWNMTLAFDPTVADCRVELEGTAATAGEITNGWTPAGTWPFLRYAVPLTDAQGDLVCRLNPLDHVGGVTTEYTPSDTPRRFCHEYDGAAASTLEGCVSADEEDPVAGGQGGGQAK